MGDNENNQGGQGEPAPPSENAGETPDVKATPKEASLGDRKNAAKAFYRALYSGEDVVPEEFGIGTKTVEKQATGPCPNCARLEAEAKESEKKASDNENYYKRIAADFENYRKRNDREREEAVGLGIQKAIESILPALDDLDRAKTSLATVTDTKAVVDSLNLVFARFSKCLEPLGVKPMEVLGEHFDPKFHEPVQEVKTTYFADGAVAQELRRGYMMRDKVIRPALVNVASNESGVITPMPASTEPATREATAEAPVKETSAPTASDSSASEPDASSPAAAAEADASESKAEASEQEKTAPENTATENTATEQTGESTASSGTEEKNGEQPSEESEKAAIDVAANKQRAANALERLRKPNPKATAELPAFRPEELLRAPEVGLEPGGGSHAEGVGSQNESNQSKESNESEKSEESADKESADKENND